ncbi:head GIN domain-containing protein [Spirosoma utsteinense]|uniref:Putative auto-transporter adhesin head GIN domain-containing protein n=1 Tax=Spirosoma utsteinense TaxID=2585773 RepID=A0ABR6WEP7_9BACT|nr:head GIN domain-containing protein [Spirosoma utsteinense]MBC3788424.1 hypothetical protein [Spirosoma utsteinense]MBC3794485.1 hypothetical protein [Spirosoma utsteinense]
MKNALVFLLLITWLSTPLFAQQSLTGNGQIVKQQRTIGTFDKVNVRVGMRVQITTGNAGSAELEGESNILEHVITNVKNGELTVMLDQGKSYNQTKAVTVTIHVSKLDRVAISTGCSVTSDIPIQAENLTLLVETGSNLTSPVSSKKLNLTVKEGSKATLEGKTGEATIRLSDAGKLEAKRLTIEKATINVEGASNASIVVTGTIAASADGVSTITYGGNPTVTAEAATGLSRIRKQR